MKIVSNNCSFSIIPKKYTHNNKSVDGLIITDDWSDVTLLQSIGFDIDLYKNFKYNGTKKECRKTLKSLGCKESENLIIHEMKNIISSSGYNNTDAEKMLKNLFRKW